MENYSIVYKINRFSVMVYNYLLISHFIKLVAFKHSCVVSIYNNKQTVFTKTEFRFLRRHNNIRILFSYFVYKHSRQIFLHIYDKVSVYTDLPYSSGKTCSRADSVHIGKPVSHYVHIVAAVDHFLYSV